MVPPIDPPAEEPMLVHYVRLLQSVNLKLLGWTPPDGIYVPKWRC